MSERTEPGGPVPIETRMRASLSGAVEAVAGDPNANPLEVFPNPADAERREDIRLGVDLTEEQEVAFRGAMAELGLGRETNRGAAELGLSVGYTAFLEGGQGHKMVAEMRVATADSVVPGMIIVSGDSGREIPEAERALTAKVLGIDESEVGQTEYDVADQVARTFPGFEEAGSPEDLPYAYDQDGVVTDEASGQFRQIGRIGSTPVTVMRVEREYFEDKQTGEQKYRRPSNKMKMEIVRGMYLADELGFVTSSTYQPSIEVDAMKVGDSGFNVQVPSYGMAELADVKGEEVATPPTVHQLAAEAYKVAHNLENF